ncbi:glycosyltransferase family 39 protein [Symbioplanes lichenis]|uniref:glycosyltransferase family 39 protein n=1 Tax=Symbioplanes lichenis TaxID=1629072 RepID=UPI002739373F|nr:glycosyltransferase family 39 protein [Actinoplanes lichenis]
MTEQVSADAPSHEAPPPAVGAGAATPPIAWRPVLITAAAVAVLMTAVSGRIGAYSNELYFIGAGGHPAWGYVDQPPLAPVLAHGLWSIAHSLVLLRLPATLCMVAMIVLSALTARELGGERRAQTTAALTTATSILLLSLSATLATTAIDSALWATVLWLVARWNRLRQDRLLLIAALVTAVALENKYLVVSLWAVMIIAVLIAGPREMLRRPLLWIGGAVAVLSAVPGLLWQASHDWPQIEMSRVIAEEAAQDAGGRLGFLPLVLFYAGIPVGVALAIRGVIRLWRNPSHRFLGITAAGVVLAFLIAGGRHTYTGGLLPLLFAAGSIGLTGRVWRVVAGAPGLILAALIAVPLSLSVLPVSTGAQVNILTRGSTGWPQLVDTVAQAYKSAGPGPVALVTDTYRQAGALDAYGEDKGLPKAYSPDRGYSAFGPPAAGVTTVVWVGDEPPAEFRAAFTEAKEVARYTGNPDGYLGINADVPVWLCTGFQGDWAQLWSRIEHYDSRDRVAA